MTTMCEDYPCCGHDAGECGAPAPDMDAYYREAARMAATDYYYDEG